MLIQDSAIAISMGQTITISTILDQVPKLIPGLPSSAVLTAGAANLQAVAPVPEVLTILRSIRNTAVSRTMILSTALVAASVPFTFGMEWLNAKKVADERKRLAGVEKRSGRGGTRGDGTRESETVRSENSGTRVGEA